MRTGRGGAQARVARGRQCRSWLAIFSLLVQLAATAGHFHPEDFAFLGGKGETLALAAAGGQGGVAPAGGGQPGLPAHDDCSLCFSWQLAGASALPVSADVGPSTTYVKATLALPCELRLSSARHLLFQTRAPPIV